MWRRSTGGKAPRKQPGRRSKKGKEPEVQQQNEEEGGGNETNEENEEGEPSSSTGNELIANALKKVRARKAPAETRVYTRN